MLKTRLRKSMTVGILLLARIRIVQLLYDESAKKLHFTSLKHNFVALIFCTYHAKTLSMYFPVVRTHSEEPLVYYFTIFYLILLSLPYFVALSVSGDTPAWVNQTVRTDNASFFPKPSLPEKKIVLPRQFSSC